MNPEKCRIFYYRGSSGVNAAQWSGQDETQFGLDGL